MAFVTSRPVKCQVALKNPLLKPSGPGDLVFGIENMAVLISLSEKGAHSGSCYSMDKKFPMLMI